MRAVFLGFLRHQADVGHRAHGGRIERAVRFAIVDHGLVDIGIAAIRDHRLGVLQLAFSVPHLTRIANHRRHRCIDDHITGHMQVGDALVGIDHRQGRTLRVFGLDIGLDLRLLRFRQRGDTCVQIADAVVGIEADRRKRIGMLAQRVLIELADHHTEQHRVGDLHHGGFQMHREQHILGLGIGDLGIDEAGQCALAQHRGIDDFASLDRHFVLQHAAAAIIADECDLQRARSCHRGGLLAAEEVALVHVRHMRLGVAAPLAHAVRMLACVIFYRQRRAAIRLPSRSTGLTALPLTLS